MSDGAAGTEAPPVRLLALRRVVAQPLVVRRIAARSRLVGGAALVMGATLAWHASNFTFNVVAARSLSSSDYGDLAAAVALLYIVSPLFVSVQTVASRLTTERATAGKLSELRALARYYGVRLALAALVVASAVAAASPALAHALHIRQPVALVVVAASLPLAVVVHMQRGVFQGVERFGRFGLSTAAEAVIKVVTAVVFVAWVWPSVAGAVLGVAAGLLAALILNAFLLRFLPRSPTYARPAEHPYRYSLAAVASLSLLALLLSLDVVAAKRFLSPQQAGLYAAIALGGKVVFFATSGINWIVFPRFSRLIDEGVDARPLLRRAFLVTGLVGAAICAAYFSAPRMFVAVLFSSRYPSAGHYMGAIAIGYAGYCVAYTGAIYLLALRALRGTAALALAVIAQVAAFALFHSAVGDLVAVQVGVLCSAGLTLALLCLTRSPLRVRP